MALATLLAAVPTLAADHTISSGTVIYPGGSYAANDTYTVSGATTVLQIQSGSLPLTNTIDLQGGATLDNAGTITRTGAHNHGVVAGVGVVKNHSGGQITAGDSTGIGVLLDRGGTVENSGEDSLIRGGLRGIAIQGGTAIVSNTDGATIESTAESAIYIDADTGEISNGVGSTIKGKGTGIRAKGELTIDNYGTIEGIDSDGISITNGTVTNSGTGALIEAGDSGIFIDGEGEVFNEDGARIDAVYDGVIMNWGGDVTNSGGSSIEGGRTGVVIWDFGTVTNSGDGSLISGDSVGVDFTPYAMSGPFLLINEDGADVVGGYAGVRVWGDETGTPHSGGRIENSGTGSSITADSYGVFFEEGAIGDVLNEDEALIKSNAGSGVVFYAGGTLVNQSGAQIEAKVDGVYSLGGDTSVTNKGAGSSISGQSRGIYISGDGDTNSIANSDGASIGGGISVEGAVTITNSGTDSAITGDGYTIHLLKGGSVENTGGATISGGEIGIYFDDANYDTGGTPGLTGTVTNGVGSTISASTTGIHSLIDTTVHNAGLIEGNVWLLDSAANHVTLVDGSKITGELYIGSNSTSTLTLTGTGTQLYSDAVSDETIFSSTVIKKGSGTWTIDKHIDASVFNIDEGTLILSSGAGVAATVYANAGTVVKGSGTIYGNLITENATIAPGNSPGVLTIVGGYLQDATTIYELEFDRDANLMDQIVVERTALNAGDGNAILLAGAALNVTQLGASAVAVGTRHAVLAAEGSLTGTFTLTGNLTISPFLALEDQYDNNNAYLAVVQTRSLTEATTDPDQTAIAEALESAPPGNDALSALLSLPDDAAAASALDQLTGDIHSDLRAGLATAERPLREAALDRLRTALCAADCEPGATLWSRGYGLSAAQGGLDINTGGLLVGADIPGPGATRYGVFAGAGATGMGEATSGDFTAGAYGSSAAGQLALRWGAATTTHSVTTERQVVFPGFAETLTANYSALGTQAFAEAGYRIEAGPVGLEPFANLAYGGLATAGFTESGGDAALSVEASNSAMLLATLGLAVDVDLGAGTLRASAGWQHVVMGRSTDAVLGFAGGETRAIGGVDAPADSLVLGLDVELALGETASLSVGYDGLIADGLTQHGAKAELRVGF